MLECNHIYILQMMTMKLKEPLYPETEDKLFVGNVSLNVTPEILKQAFQEHDTVVGARVLYDGETGRSRGYGFVSYANKSEMEAALTVMDNVSDVYSYGVVLLKMLTGMEPTDNRIPEGAHIVTWVISEIREKKREFASTLDQQLVLQGGTRTPEMLQVLGVALLYVNPSPEERPTMKDVTSMLKEIKHGNEDLDKPNMIHKGNMVTNPKAAVHCSSFSRSCELLIESSSSS